MSNKKEVVVIDKKDIQMTDEQIFKGCIDNNPLAQEYLYKKYHKDMFKVCLRYANYDFKEAEDMLQNGFIMVFRKIDQYKGTGPLVGWIRRVIVNVSLTMVRKNKLNHLSIMNESGVDKQVFISSPFTNYTDQNVNNKDLLKIIQTLPTGFKTVFNLYAIEGYSHKEIGDMLGISEGTSKSQYSRAKTHLKKMVVESGFTY